MGVVKVGKTKEFGVSFVAAVSGALPSELGALLFSLFSCASKENNGDVPNVELGGAGEADG